MPKIREKAQAAVSRIRRKKRRTVEFDFESTMLKLYKLNEVTKTKDVECINRECPDGLCTECVMHRVMDIIKEGIVS